MHGRSIAEGRQELHAAFADRCDRETWCHPLQGFGQGFAVRRTAVVLFAGIVLLLMALSLIWVRSPFGIGEFDANTLQTVTLGLLAGCGLFVIILFWLLVRFEGNRWEVYF